VVKKIFSKKLETSFKLLLSYDTKQKRRILMNSGEFLIPITFFAAIAAVLYNFIKSRHSERMAIIDKGLNEEQLRYLLKAKKGMFLNSSWSVKLGAVLIGVGMAVIIGTMMPYDIREEITTGLVFMLPGIGLLLVYKFADNKPADEE